MYIDIDELNMYSDVDDEGIFKFKKKYMSIIDKIYNKMNNITEVIGIIIKINDELKKNIESIHEILFKLLDDLRLRQVEVNTINAKIDDALNFVWNKIYRKNRKNRRNRIGLKRINRDKLKLLERMYTSTNDIISETKNEIKMIYIDMYKLYEKNIDEIHLINSEIKKIIIRLKQNLKKIFSVEDLLCR